jgi:two-component system chemotaxis sensor kinase CheA
VRSSSPSRVSVSEIESGGSDAEIVTHFAPCTHHMRGRSRRDLVRFAHILETVLDEVRKGKLATASPVVETLLRAADGRRLVRSARRRGVDDGRIGGVKDELLR